MSSPDISKCSVVPLDTALNNAFVQGMDCGWAQGVEYGLTEQACTEKWERKVQQAYIIGAAISFFVCLIVYIVLTH